MTSPDRLDPLAIPAEFRPCAAAGYRELAAGNYLLYAMTGTAEYRVWAEYAETAAATLEACSVIVWDGAA